MIIDLSLRYRSEQKAAHCAESKKQRNHARSDSRAHDTRETTTSRDERKSAICRRDQSTSESNPFRFIRVEQARGRTPLQRRSDLPRQVHGVADAGVHPLSADRTVDVRGVAEQKGAPVAKVERDAVVHAISRKPVHLHDVELEVLE